ncbi:MAG TPA: hypothetical protein VEI06_16765 [Gemmatimonadaceae bacterium]|nr:hypothetical protein [Gemmatimonadaceae bacterium]
MRGPEVRVAIAAAIMSSVVAMPLAAQRERDARDWVSRCQDWNGGDDSERYCEVRQSAMKPTGKAIRADAGENGGVEVQGWDRDSIAIEARIQTNARTLDDAKKIASQVRIVSTDGSIRAEGPMTGHREWWSVSFVVSVPRKSSLTLEAHNGPVAATRVNGTLDLTTVNGPVVLDEVAGTVRGRTTNGPVVVDLAGSKWDGTGLDAETTNGPVTLSVPDGYNAHLETGTVNGPFEIGFPITVEGKLGRHISTDLGKGGPTIRAVTTNGPVHVKRPSSSSGT